MSDETISATNITIQYKVLTVETTILPPNIRSLESFEQFPKFPLLVRQLGYTSVSRFWIGEEA
jgi:hypothetical protein